MYSILEAEKLIREDNVKIIFMVRDPRGMAPSRMKFNDIYTPEENFNDVVKGQVKLHPKMEVIVTDYCNWLMENHMPESQLPDWLRGKYLVIRYEDTERHQSRSVQTIFDFLGLEYHEEDIRQVLEELAKFEVFEEDNNSERWRKKLRIEEVKRVQELCTSKLFKELGYKLVKTELELRNSSISLVNDI
uniref:Carbohydrate sulfotransferase 1-like n=1 Tax=Saccoglossus kowalevskii TaxID=10224 RepID=A0ABM0M3P4_SACKO|nr:PREDICTED: carbohydrate sulfotransferase 1-like [Saccoglossus kowalevskii]